MTLIVFFFLPIGEASWFLALSGFVFGKAVLL